MFLPAQCGDTPPQCKQLHTKIITVCLVVVIAVQRLRTSASVYTVDELLVTEDLQSTSGHLAQPLYSAQSSKKGSSSAQSLILYWAHCSLINPVHNHTCKLIIIGLDVISVCLDIGEESLSKLLLGVDGELIYSHLVSIG